jgi:alpha-L-fucosidase
MEAGTPAWHFTTKGGSIYAIASAWPGSEALITSLASGRPSGTVASVTLLGNTGSLNFTQDEQGLKIRLPAEHSGSMAWAFRIVTRAP